MQLKFYLISNKVDSIFILNKILLIEFIVFLNKYYKTKLNLIIKQQTIDLKLYKLK